MTRDELLALDDTELAKRCKFEAYKSGGPGGQKRNKTSSAAKITHVELGISAHSSDFRSQAENRKRALHRLRFKLAAEIRTPIDPRGYEPPAWFAEARVQGKLTTNTHNPVYARLAAHALDVFAAVDGRLSDASALLGVSNSNLVHHLKAEHAMWSVVSRIRSDNKLPPL
jgi:RF-1 domain